MSKLLILNDENSTNKYSIIELKNIEFFEEKMGKPDTSNEISDWNASNQNLGVCCVYAREAIQKSNIEAVFIEICRRSIAKFKTTTDDVNQEEIAKSIGISSRTVRTMIKELEKKGFLKVNKSCHKYLGTGSFPNSYTPIFKQNN